MNDLSSGFKIADLIVKRLEGKLSEEEEQLLEEWKYAGEENLVLFHKLSQNPEKRYFNRETKLENANKHLVWSRIKSQVKKDKRHKLKLTLLKVAAVLVIGLSLTVFLTYIRENAVYNQSALIPPGNNKALLVLSDGEKYELSNKLELDEKGMQISNSSKELVYSKKKDRLAKNQLVFNTIIIPKGGEYKLTLSDGTIIWLNSNSKLRYPSKFGRGERRVYLEGEAFFEVVKDVERPFIVNATNSEVKVLGTSFNVNAYNDQDEIQTTLVEGKVEVKDDLFGRKQQLLPNEQLVLNKLNGNTTKQKVNTYTYTAWKDGRFVFENSSLENIMIRLSRWYDVEVFFLTNSIKDLKYTGDVARYDTIDSILEMIEVTEKVKFTIKDRSIMVEKSYK